MKVASLLNFLRAHKPFGKVEAGMRVSQMSYHLLRHTYICMVSFLNITWLLLPDLYTIEFQKRGLPHCHLLLWVNDANKIRDPEQLDRYISAVIPDPAIDPALYKVVTELMMHGPCGVPKPNAPCMKDGVCSKHFPKPFQVKTKFDKNGYAQYKRPESALHVEKNGLILDNGFVIPYNPLLLQRFHAHINVEYCGWNMLIKYLFKYISKGTDRIRYAISRATTSLTNDNGIYLYLTTCMPLLRSVNCT
jgi:hypothetical protein